MDLRIVVLSLTMSGCGFGFGAVDGPSREYAHYALGDFYKDSSGTHVDSSGQRWRRGTGAFLGNSTPGAGVLLGFRRGIAWTHYGEQLDGARSADYFFTGYYRMFALSAGYTSDSGTVAIPYSPTMTLNGSMAYTGYYLEPALALVSTGPIYVAATFAVISGTAGLGIEGRSSTTEADARGLRPGLRLGLTVIPIGPVRLKLGIDVRYLITPDVQLVTGGMTTPESYGGISTAFALNFVL